VPKERLINQIIINKRKKKRRREEPFAPDLEAQKSKSHLKQARLLKCIAKLKPLNMKRQ